MPFADSATCTHPECNPANDDRNVARPITPEDVIAAADKAYDLGRKHGRDEKADLLDWAETLLCNAVPMAHCTQAEWDATVRRWRDEKHGVSTPNAGLDGRRTKEDGRE